MIQASEAIAVGRRMLGTPYSTYDCINFIKAILRQAPGGEKRYTVAGTNSLWRSRDLTERRENLNQPLPGMLAFKVNGSDVHHVGLVTGPRTVLHSSSAKGCVVETDLLNGQWHYLARHRLIALEGNALENSKESSNTEVLYQATVVTESTGLRLRAAPENGLVLMAIPKGAQVDVLEEGEWPKVAYRGKTGYVSGTYLSPQGRPQEENEAQVVSGGGNLQTTTIISQDGCSVILLGSWRVAND